MKPRTKNRSRESERLKRNQLLPLKYRYSERRKGAHVAAAIKIRGASIRTRHLWPPFCLLFRSRACEKTWVHSKTINQSEESLLCCSRVSPQQILTTVMTNIVVDKSTDKEKPHSIYLCIYLLLFYFTAIST